MSLKIAALDDEQSALNVLSRAVMEAEPDCELALYLDPEELVRDIINEIVSPDIVFLDIEMYEESGIQIAKRLRQISTNIKIVFMTGFSEYAMEAFSVNARGYLLKPANTEAVKQQIEVIKSEKPLTHDEGVRVQTFGNFEVFVNGDVLRFKYHMSKEVFAYLIDRRGASCTMEELRELLWGDEAESGSRKSQMRNMISDIRSAFEQYNLKDVVVKSRNSIAVRRDRVLCDFYQYLRGDVNAINTFSGEYMSNYAWAKGTRSRLLGTDVEVSSHEDMIDSL